MNSNPASDPKRRATPRRVPLLAAIALAIALAACRPAPGPSATATTHTIQREAFTAWSVFEGTIQAERRAPVYSLISQPSAVLFLAPEGSHVDAGDLVAELDRSALDQTLAALERDHALAEAELAMLLQADIPAESATAAYELESLRHDVLKQERLVLNTEKLAADGLVSASELEEQRLQLANQQTKVTRQEQRLTSLRDVVHPARTAKARAQLDAAARQLDLLRAQAASARMIAPMAGMVVYLPLHIDGEFRNVREGDTVYRNQKIIQIADMESLLVFCQVPESSISAVRPGHPAIVTPTAFPDLALRGTVDAVGSVAVSVAGRPAWQKFFNVTIRLTDTDSRLRSSMTVAAKIIAREETDVLVLPRAFVAWDQGRPWCLAGAGGRFARRDLTLGPGNASAFIVLDGLAEGDLVQLPRSAP